MNVLRRFSLMFAAVMAGLTLVLGFLVIRTYENNAIEKAKGDLGRLIQLQAGYVCAPSDFTDSMDRDARKEAQEHFLEISKIPDSLMTNVFSTGGVVIWSTEEDEIGGRYGTDEDLAKALAGKVSASISAPYHGSRSFEGVKEILEVYVPIVLPGQSRVSGIIEVYQNMGPLRASILKANMAVSGTLLIGFGILYVLLFGMVRRLHRQDEQIREVLRKAGEKAHSDRMELLKKIGASAIEATGVDGLLKEATTDACVMLDLSRCTVRLFGDPDMVVEHCEPGFPSSASFFPVTPRPEDSKTIAGNGGTIVVSDVRTSPLFGGKDEALERIRLGAYIGVPMRIQEGVIGAVFLDRAEAHEWTENEVRTAEALARQIAVAIRHVRLFETNRELAGRLVSLMDNVPGAVYRGLRDWSIVYAGAEIERITGYPAKDFLDGSVRWPDIVLREDMDVVKRRFREAVAGSEKVLRVEYRIRRKDGKVLWVADRRQLSFDAEGSFLHVDGLLLDITERKRDEEALLLTQFAVDRSGDAAYWMEPDGRLIYVNELACRILGYSRDELLSMKIHDVNPGFPPQVWAAHWEDLRRRKSYTMETSHRAKDGRLVPVEVTVNYVEFFGKEYNCVSARDITERIEGRERSRRLEVQLLQSQKMEAIGSLAGGIAHDFNNLLTGILGYANLLKNKAGQDVEVLRAAGVIQDAADRASQLTAQLLGFARKGKHLVTPVDVRKTVDAVTELVERTLDKRIRVRKSFADGLPSVEGDPTQLRQCLLNLAMNAGDAMPGGGDMTISAEVEDLDEAACARLSGVGPGRYVVIRVEDTGVGIPEENLKKIFDPFFTTKGMGKGTGLGLSMVFGIVKNHGGHIAVESRVGEGSRFTIYLPSTGSAPMEEPDFPPVERPGTGKGCILLVDDQEAVRDVCGAMLQSLGYTVIKAVDGLEGVEQYRRFGKEIALVIIDMVMPNLGGRDCFLRIKKMNPDVRAVLTTGFSMDGAVQEIMREGLTGFIQKPFRLDQLSRTVEKALGRNDAVSSDGLREKLGN